MNGLPEYCDECGEMVSVKEKAFVRTTGEIKLSGEITFRESLGGIWCEDCIILLLPAEANPNAR